MRENPDIRLLLIGGIMLSLTACNREERRFRSGPPGLAVAAVVQSELRPGLTPPTPPGRNPLEGNAHAIAEGHRLYRWFNCVGCHFNGGGGIGPPLMDEKWIYGSEPANIFSTIVEGRPNGMPAFRHRLTDQQVWQIVAYVRTLSRQPDAGEPPGRPKGKALDSDNSKQSRQGI